jgi:hypothetical protein
MSINESILHSILKPDNQPRADGRPDANSFGIAQDEGAQNYSTKETLKTVASAADKSKESDDTEQARKEQTSIAAMAGTQSSKVNFSTFVEEKSGHVSVTIELSNAKAGMFKLAQKFEAMVGQQLHTSFDPLTGTFKISGSALLVKAALADLMFESSGRFGQGLKADVTIDEGHQQKSFEVSMVPDTHGGRFVPMQINAPDGSAQFKGNVNLEQYAFKERIIDSTTTDYIPPSDAPQSQITEVAFRGLQSNSMADNEAVNISTQIPNSTPSVSPPASVDTPTISTPAPAPTTTIPVVVTPPVIIVTGGVEAAVAVQSPRLIPLQHLTPWLKILPSH